MVRIRPFAQKSSCTKVQADPRGQNTVRNLIVNADDLGWTDGINRGILEAFHHGIVTSTSLLANGAAFAGGVDAARSAPGLGVGVHLNLSDGPPVAPRESVASLLNAAGDFAHGPESLLLRRASGGLALEEVEREWNMQTGKILAAGITATHLDGHKHVHMLPGLFEVALRVAKRHGIGAIRVALEASSLRAALSSGSKRNLGVVMKQGVQARGLKLLARDAREQAEHAGISTADYFCGIAQTGELTREGVEQLVKSLPDGTTELMCHPGYMDSALQKTTTRLQDSRQTELQILTDTGIRNLVASLGIRLIDYGFVAQEA
jgi:predicted glycoside hydrolase/deacetylase ChbG (UPF0249 family)